jgi:hypothetical protein
MLMLEKKGAQTAQGDRLITTAFDVVIALSAVEATEAARKHQHLQRAIKAGRSAGPLSERKIPAALAAALK